MKKLLFLFFILSSCTNTSTGSNKPIKEHSQTVDNIEDAIMYIEASQEDATGMKLGLLDPMLYGGKKVTRGYAVQIIEKTISKTKGWRFDGYEIKGDVHFYKFKKK